MRILLYLPQLPQYSASGAARSMRGIAELAATASEAAASLDLIRLLPHHSRNGREIAFTHRNAR